jgi:hypothetical protein
MIDKQFELLSTELSEKDISRIANISDRQARRRRRKIRLVLGKTDNDPITLAEYRKVFNIKYP